MRLIALALFLLAVLLTPGDVPAVAQAPDEPPPVFTLTPAGGGSLTVTWEDSVRAQYRTLATSTYGLVEQFGPERAAGGAFSTTIDFPRQLGAGDGLYYCRYILNLNEDGDLDPTEPYKPTCFLVQAWIEGSVFLPALAYPQPETVIP